MEYTDYGLRIGLDELRKMLEYAENRAQYGNMEHCLYIKGGRATKHYTVLLLCGV